MNLLHSLPDGLVTLMARWLVPLFLLYNIVGWTGLPGREARRSNPRLSEQELADLVRAVRGAWLVGLLVGLATLCGIFEFFPTLLQNQTLAFDRILVAGIIGALLGIARGFLPGSVSFRGKSVRTRRQILSSLVISAVSLSIACIALYYNSGLLVKGFIASTYACMLIGYAAAHVFEVGK